MEVKKTLGMVTTALVDITTPVDYLSQGKALQAATLSAQLWTRAGENSSAAPSACFHPFQPSRSPQARCHLSVGLNHQKDHPFTTINISPLQPSVGHHHQL